MATVEQRHPAVTENGTKSGIPVENPATGEVITTVPDLSADEVKKIAAKAREAQPAGRRWASRSAARCSCARRSGSPTTPSASST